MRYKMFTIIDLVYYDTLFWLTSIWVIQDAQYEMSIESSQTPQAPQP